MKLPRRLILFLLIFLLVFSGCSSEDPLEDIRNYRSSIEYTGTAPKLDPNNREGNLFVYIVLLNFDDIYDTLWDSYYAIFELYDNHGNIEQFEDLRYSGNFAAGDFSDVFDSESFMWICDDIHHGEYHTSSAYTQNFAGYLYDCYELAEPCTRLLDDIWVVLDDSVYGLGEYSISELKNSIIQFKDSMYLFKQAIDSLDPIREWFCVEWLQ